MANPSVKVKDEATGRRIEVSPAQAMDGYLKGAYTPLEARVRVARGSKTGTVPASQIRAAIDSGWDIISEEQASAAKLHRDQTTAGRTVQGVAEAAASGLLLGIPDLVATTGTTLTPQERKEYIARQKGLGTTGDIARLAGEVLPVLLTGGAAAGAKGALTATAKVAARVAAKGAGKSAVRRGASQAVRAAGALPRAVEGLGVMAEAGVRRVAGDGLKGRALGAFARGGVEGGFSGLSQEIHESALGEREITGERALMAVGMGTIFGGSVSSAFPITGAAFRKAGTVTQGATRSLLAKAQGLSPDGSIIGDMVQTVTSGKRAGPATKQIGLLMRDNATLKRSLHEAPEYEQKLAADLAAASEELTDAQRRGVMAFEADRGSNLGDLLVDTADGQVARYVVDDIAAAVRRVDDHMAVAKAYPRNFDMMALDKSRDALRFAEDAAGGAKAGRAYSEQLRALRKVQLEVRRVSKQGKSPDTLTMLEDVESTLRKSLGSSKYGKAGEAFVEVSNADAAFFEAAKRMGKTSRGRLMDRNVQSTNADALDVVKSSGAFKAADRADAMRRSIDLDAAAMRARAKYSSSPDVHAAAFDLQAASAKIDSVLAASSEHATILARQTEMNRSPMSGVLTAMGPSGPALAGAMLGGPIGMGIGAGLAVMARPGSAIRTMSAIKHAADGSKAKISKILDAATASGEPLRKKITKAAKAVGAAGRTSATAVRKVGTRAAGRVGGSGGRNEKQKAQQKRALELSDPAVLERELATEMFTLTKVAPAVADVMALRVRMGAQFLASKLPMEVHDPILGSERVIDSATRDAFERYHEAATDPISALERLADGSFTSEHAEALRAVWPSMYAHAQETVLTGLQEASDEGREVPYQQRAALGILLDIPTHITMTPEFMQAMGKVHTSGRSAEANAQQSQQAKQAPQPQGDGKRTRKVSYDTPDTLKTSLDSIGEA